MRYVTVIVLAVLLAGCLSTSGSSGEEGLLEPGTTLTYSYAEDGAGTKFIRAHVDAEDDAAWHGYLAHEVNDTVQVRGFRLMKDTANLGATAPLREGQLGWTNRTYTAPGLRLDVFPFLLTVLASSSEDFSIDTLVQNGSTTYTGQGGGIEVRKEGETTVDDREVYNITVGPDADIVRRDRTFVTRSFPHVLVRHHDISFNSSIRLESVERGGIDLPARYANHTWVTG